MHLQSNIDRVENPKGQSQAHHHCETMVKRIPYSKGPEHSVLVCQQIAVALKSAHIDKLKPPPVKRGCCGGLVWMTLVSPR